MARSRWGWHQLDPQTAQLVVDDAGVGRGDLVLDIGAGLGALTDPLVATGASVIAVELHPGRAAALRERFGGRARVVCVDAADLRLPRRPFHVVANPPFGVSSALLRRLLASGSRLQTATVVLQRQTAVRWAGPDAPGRRRWERTHQVSLGRPIPRHAFRPRPSVDAAVLDIRRR